MEYGNLVLSRKIGEAVIINGNIRVEFSSHKSNGGIRLFFRAPKDVTIVREELLHPADAKIGGGLR